MFGWRLVREPELELKEQLHAQQLASLREQLKSMTEYAAKCERLIDHERERIDGERERADRIADSLFQANGLPATSTTVVQEQKTADAEMKLKRDEYLDQLMQIYGETEHDMIEDGAEPLPAELAETIK